MANQIPCSMKKMVPNKSQYSNMRQWVDRGYITTESGSHFGESFLSLFVMIISVNISSADFLQLI